MERNRRNDRYIQKRECLNKQRTERQIYKNWKAKTGQKLTKKEMNRNRKA